MTPEPQQLLDNWYRDRYGWVPTKPGRKPCNTVRDRRDWNMRNRLWVQYCEERNEINISPRREHLYFLTLFEVGPEPVYSPIESSSHRRVRWGEVQEWYKKFATSYEKHWMGTADHASYRYSKHFKRYRAWWRLQEKLYEQS